MSAHPLTVLVAESDPHLLLVLCSSLCREGYTVLRAQDGLHALSHVILAHPHLLIVEGQLPQRSGFEVCTQVREFSTVPIIMLTAPGADHDRVRALHLGGDDALSKPIVMEELLARVRSVLRRVQMADAVDVSALRALVTLGDLTVDCGQGVVTLAGHSVHLSSTEYRVLLTLTRHLGRVVSKEILLEQVWGASDGKASNLLQVTINRLRHKLEADSTQTRYLQTKPGVGYLLKSPYTQEHEGCSPRRQVPTCH
jgi:DNA-binding response OmpR family regulator